MVTYLLRLSSRAHRGGRPFGNPVRSRRARLMEDPRLQAEGLAGLELQWSPEEIAELGSGASGGGETGLW